MSGSPLWHEPSAAPAPARADATRDGRRRLVWIATAGLGLTAGIFVLDVIMPQQRKSERWHAL